MKVVCEMREVNQKRLRTLFLLELPYEVFAATVNRFFAYEYSDIFHLERRLWMRSLTFSNTVI
jgi:hypothetical protein